MNARVHQIALRDDQKTTMNSARTSLGTKRVYFLRTIPIEFNLPNDLQMQTKTYQICSLAIWYDNFGRNSDDENVPLGFLHIEKTSIY